MNDLISRSALLKQVSKVKEEYLHPYIVGSILQAPPVDAVPVVRCKDCKYHNAPACPMRLSFNWTDDNDFCSYGERRNGDATD